MSKIHPSEIASFTRFFYRVSDLATIKRNLSNISDINLPVDVHQNRLLHKAALYGAVNVAKGLIEYRANIYVQNDKGELPIHFAIYGGNVKIVELLIDHGQDVNSLLGGLPLNLAVILERIEIIKVLLEKGAKMDLRNGRGPFCPTAWESARMLGNTEICEIMKKARKVKQQKPKVKTTEFENCVICEDERNGDLFALIPCLHANLCQNCCKKILNDNNPKCPTCRIDVSRFQKVFY